MSYSYSSNIDSGELVKYSSVWPIEIFALIGQFPQLGPPLGNCQLFAEGKIRVFVLPN